MKGQIQNRERPIITFGVVADVQYSDYEAGVSRFYRGSTVKLKEAVSQFRADSAEFIVSMGDLIDKDFDSFKPVLDILSSSGLKTYHIAGNHDYSVKKSEIKHIPLIDSTGMRYFSMVRDRFRFIFLDGNDISLHASSSWKKQQQANDLILSMRKTGTKNALDWNGAIGSKQMRWLGKELRAAENKGEKALLFCHFPVAPDDSYNLLNDKEVLGFIAPYPSVIAWFSGHNHEGNYVRLGPVHHLTFKGMVETEFENSFATVRVYGDRVEIKGYGREENRVLDF